MGREPEVRAPDVRAPEVRVWIAGIVVVATLLRIGALQVGHVMDDFAQLAMLAGSYPVERAPWDLFAFCRSPEELRALVDAGAFPWWSDPELRLATLRPLPSLTLALDVAVFGRDPWPAHVHSALWWIAMLLAAARLLLGTLPARWALLAFALFALDECHAQPLAWLANRNASMAAAFGFLAIDAHLRWRRGGAGHQRWIAAAALAASFACGESALGALAYLLAWELGPGRARPARGAIVPLVIVVALWAAAHRLGGYGAFASGVYVDPVAEPLAWLAVAWQRLPIAAADLLFALPTGRLAFHEHGPALQLAAGLVGVAIAIAWWLRRRDTLARDDRDRFAMFGLGAALALLPAASAFPSARLLVFPALGCAVWIAGWLVRGLRSAAALWLVPHAIAAPVWSWLEIDEVRRFGAAAERAALDAPWPTDPRAPIVLLRAPDPFTMLYPPLAHAIARETRPPPWLVLLAQGGAATLTVDRTGTIDLQLEGGMLGTPVEQMFRRDDRMPKPGEHTRAGSLDVVVVAVDDRGRPTHVRVAPAGAPPVAWIATAGGLLRYPWPRPGTTVTAPGAAAPTQP